MTAFGVMAAMFAGIALPHLLPLRAATPSAAIAIWGSSLALRAIAVVLAAAYTIIYLPGSALFTAFTHWCWHSILPLMSAHLGLDGHRLGDLALVMPSLLLVVSILWVAYGVVRATRTVRRFLRRHAVGPGPQDSLIVGGPEVLMGTAGLTHPRVIVSAGALTAFDDDELAAGLAHEQGHIARRHRYLLLLAELCRGAARLVPGTRRAAHELRFHVERDADHWALARSHDRLALASAICKAATSLPGGAPAAVSLVGAGVADRVRQLVEPAAATPKRVPVIRAAAVCLVAVTTAAAALAPAAAIAASQSLPDPGQVRHCDG